jgi:ligand-binding sensor domain-containing protein
MSIEKFSKRRWVGLLAIMIALGSLTAAFVAWRLRRTVHEALDAPLANRKALQFVALPVATTLPPRWGSDDVNGIALLPAGLMTAGGAGVLAEGQLQAALALPTLRVNALALWRGHPVAAPAAGGFYRLGEGHWDEARAGWGHLHIRALLEAPGGELLIGAREGLYRAAWGATTIERLDSRPVRALASGSGYVLAGGEQGLLRVEASRVEPLRTPDPWVECLELDGEQLWVVTAAGLARGSARGAIEPVSGGEDIAGGVFFEGAFLGLAQSPAAVIQHVSSDGRISEEPLPAPARRLLVSAGVLFADTLDGLFRRAGKTWVRARPRAAALPGEKAHVGALARLGTRIVVGLFDGGLAQREAGAADAEWQAVPGSQAWGVNALLPAGGALYVASLRGAARFDGRRLEALEGPGAAFSLASTERGVAIGYGQGVQLPGVGLLSAFHGLPGNQALALAEARPALYVGTPSGLGEIEGRRVRWQVTQGEGHLPHSWVTALAVSGDGLYVGTYGGGIVRRLPASASTSESRSGRFEPFVETEGLKINAQCLVEVGGRLYAGTDGKGLYRLSLDRRRFERFDAPLPSPNVTALLADQDGLYVGTDEGLTRLALEPQTQDRP